MTTLTHEQLGQAIYVMHHLVWPDEEPWNRHWSHLAYDDNVPFFGFAAERYYTKRYPEHYQNPGEIMQYGRHSLVELRVMMRNLTDLFEENRETYSAKDIEPYAKTLAGVKLLLDKKVGDFDIVQALERERPLSIMDATKASYEPLKGSHALYAAFDKLLATAEQAIAQNPRADASSMWAKDYEAHQQGQRR